MLIDLHAHSSGISKCCRIPFEKVLNTALEKGMDGIVLTNHYQKSYIQNETAGAFAERYISEFSAAEQYGREIGCRVFFGIEVTMELYPGVHILLYGLTPDFLRKYPQLFDCTQKELYELVKTNNGVMVQAHPFRGGTTVLDTDFLDGVEINCHPLYGNSFSGELLEIAEKDRLIVTCGGDFHADTYRPICGMFLPDGTEDHRDMGLWLLSREEKKLCIHEPNTDRHTVISVKAFHACE